MCVSMLQQIIFDARLLDPRMVSLGRDKVFLYHFDKEASEAVFTETLDFFSEFLYDCRVWSTEGEVKCERGEWVRCLGVPLHVWYLIVVIF